MSSVWFEGVDGLNRLAVDLGRAGAGVAPRAEAAVRVTSLAVEGTGKAFAPVDTGALRNSIGTDFERGLTSGNFAATVGPTVDHGGYVEYGTSRMAPHAYMGPAFDRHAGGLEVALDALVEHLL